MRLKGLNRRNISIGGIKENDNKLLGNARWPFNNQVKRVKLLNDVINNEEQAHNNIDRELKNLNRHLNDKDGDDKKMFNPNCEINFNELELSHELIGKPIQALDQKEFVSDALGIPSNLSNFSIMKRNLNDVEDFLCDGEQNEVTLENHSSFIFDLESASHHLDSRNSTRDPQNLHANSTGRKVFEVGLQIPLNTPLVRANKERKKTPITRAPPYFREFGTIRRIDTSKPILLDSQMHLIKEDDSLIDPLLVMNNTSKLISASKSQEKDSISKFLVSSKSEEKFIDEPQAQIIRVLYTNFSKEDVEKLRAVEAQTSQVHICTDTLNGVYECDLLVVQGGLPKTAKTVLSIILGKRLIRSAWISECLITKQLEDPERFEIPINRVKIAEILAGKSYFVDEDFDREPLLNLLTREQIIKIVIASGGKVKDVLLDSDFAVLKTTAKRKLNSLPFHVKPLFYQDLIDSIVDRGLIK